MRGSVGNLMIMILRGNNLSKTNIVTVLRLLERSRISISKFVGPPHLRVPVSGAENEYHERSTRGLGRKQPKPEPRKAHFPDKPEKNRNGHAHQIKRAQIDIRSDGGPGAAS